MRKRGKVDANQPDVVKAFRRCGATVTILSNVGDGCCDLLIGYQGQNVLVEVKDGDKPPSARKLTPDQEKFIGEWKGTVAVVKSVHEAESLICAIHEHVALMKKAGMCGERWLSTGNPWQADDDGEG